jgi:hypothetical protein
MVRRSRSPDETFLLVAPAVTTELPLRATQDLTSLLRGKLSGFPAAQHITKLLHPAVCCLTRTTHLPTTPIKIALDFNYEMYYVDVQSEFMENGRDETHDRPPTGPYPFPRLRGGYGGGCPPAKRSDRT